MALNNGQQPTFNPDAVSKLIQEQIVNQQRFQPQQFPYQQSLPYSSSYQQANSPYLSNNLLNNSNSLYSNYYSNPLGQSRSKFQYDPNLHGIITKYAEKRARSSLAPIETILDAISSVSLILETTYSAFYGSFRSITAMADFIMFVRNQLINELSELPRVLNVFIDFFKWLLQALGIKAKFMENIDRKAHDKIWNSELDLNSLNDVRSLLSGSGSDENGKKGSSFLPLLIFFSLVMGAPYLLWRFLGLPGPLPKNNKPSWTLRDGQHFEAIGLTTIRSEDPRRLCFDKNQKLFVDPDSVKPGAKFVVACTVDSATKIGFVHTNSIKIIFG